jgi:hypothetical protein
MGRISIVIERSLGMPSLPLIPDCFSETEDCCYYEPRSELIDHVPIDPWGNAISIKFFDPPPTRDLFWESHVSLQTRRVYSLWMFWGDCELINFGKSFAMHRIVDTSPTRWLLGLAFYKSAPLREVEDFLLVLDSESVHLLDAASESLDFVERVWNPHVRKDWRNV